MVSNLSCESIFTYLIAILNIMTFKWNPNLNSVLSYNFCALKFCSHCKFIQEWYQKFQNGKQGLKYGTRRYALYIASTEINMACVEGQIRENSRISNRTISKLFM